MIRIPLTQLKRVLLFITTVFVYLIVKFIYVTNLLYVEQYVAHISTVENSVYRSRITSNEFVHHSRAHHTHKPNATLSVLFNESIFNYDCLQKLDEKPGYIRQVCPDDAELQCSLLTCRKLLSAKPGDKIFAIARDFMRKHPKPIKKDIYFVNMTRDCAYFRSFYGYNSKFVTPEEFEFPIAFNIIIHKDVDQLQRLLRAIYRPHNHYCIHIDAKSPKIFRRAVRGIADCLKNVFVPEQLEVITWGGYNRLQADINCMKEHLQRNTTWNYLINTAGQAFPLRTNLEMVKILKVYNGANDIEGIYGRRILRERFENEFHEYVENGTVPRTGRKNPKPPHDIDIVRGSAYGVFSRRFVQYVLNDQKAVDLLRWSRSTWSPDEFYWATLHHTYSNPHLHPPGGFSGHPHRKPWLAVYVNWVEKCFNFRKVGVCIFGAEDLPQLLGRPEFFVNKFYQHNEPLALDCFEMWVRHRELCPVNFNTEFYERMPFIKQPLP